jgi:hypothetical protein
VSRAAGVVPHTAGDPSEGAGDPSEGAGDPSEGAGDPSEGAGDPSEGAGDPSEGAGDPSANQHLCLGKANISAYFCTATWPWGSHVATSMGQLSRRFVHCNDNI